MMAAVKGHYDGTQIIMDESVNLREGQEVIVMILDLEKKDKKKIDLKKYMGRGEKMFQTDAQDYVKGLRADDRILSGILECRHAMVPSAITCTEYLTFPYKTNNAEKEDVF